MSVQRRLSSVAWICCLAFALPSNGQMSTNYSSTGPSLLAPDAPFQAERVTRTLRHLDDGSIIQKELDELISRDKSGRLFVDSFDPAHPETHNYILADPTTRQELSWSTRSNTAMANALAPTTHLQVSALPPERFKQLIPKDKSTVTVVNLDTKTILGVKATGQRTTTTVPQGVIGNSEALHFVQEVWTSDELQLVVSETDTNPISGTRTVSLSSLQHVEPPAARFTAPNNLKVHSIFSSPPPVMP